MDSIFGVDDAAVNGAGGPVLPTVEEEVLVEEAEVEAEVVVLEAPGEEGLGGGEVAGEEEEDEEGEEEEGEEGEEEDDMDVMPLLSAGGVGLSMGPSRRSKGRGFKPRGAPKAPKAQDAGAAAGGGGRLSLHRRRWWRWRRRRRRRRRYLHANCRNTAADRSCKCS